MSWVVAAIAFAMAAFLTVSGALSQPALAQSDTAVVVTDDVGTPTGSVTVVSVEDPWVGFDPNQPPPEDSRYVAVTIALDADQGTRFDIDPYAITLQDTDGILWRPSWLPLPTDALIPSLQGQSLAPGSRVTGLVGFTLPSESEIAQIYFQPEYNRLVLLAEFIDLQSPAMGEQVEIQDSEGNSGIVTVTTVEDPFTDYDPSTPPESGGRFVVATLVYENTGSTRFTIEPYGLLLQDDAGNLWSPTYLSRPSDSIVVPDLSGQRLAPGDRLSGIVAFQIPAEAAASAILLQAESGRLLTLGELASPAATGEFGPPPPISEPISADAACGPLDAWVADTRQRIATARSIDLVGAADNDPAALDAAILQFGNLAAEQEAADVPSGAETLNNALVIAFRAAASSAEQMLAAGDAGPASADEITSALGRFAVADDRIDAVERQIDAREAECAG